MTYVPAFKVDSVVQLSHVQTRTSARRPRQAGATNPAGVAPYSAVFDTIATKCWWGGPLPRRKDCAHPAGGHSTSQHALRLVFAGFTCFTRRLNDPSIS